MARGGASALRAEYSIVPGGWGGCTISLEPLQDWSAGEGLVLWIRSDAADQQVALMVFSGDPLAPSPFETLFPTTAETAGGWTRLAFLWSDLGQAEWADASSLSKVDPTRIMGYGFGLGLDETHREGILWVDDIQLLTGELETAAPERTATPEEAPPAVEPTPTLPPEPTPTVEPTPSPPPEATPTVEPTPLAASEPTLSAGATATAEVVVLAGEPPPAGEKTGGGICPLAALLPLGAAAVVVARKRLW